MRRARAAVARRWTAGRAPLVGGLALARGGHVRVREIRDFVRVAPPGRRRSETTPVRLRGLRVVLDHRGALHADGSPPANRRRARLDALGDRICAAFDENETTVQKLKIYSRNGQTAYRSVKARRLLYGDRSRGATRKRKSGADERGT